MISFALIRCRMTWACPLFLAFVFATSLPAWAASSGCGEDHQTHRDEGLKAYIDPDTGELLSEPPPGEAAGAAEGAQAEPTIPEPTVQTLPDGTLMLDLSDQPANELRAEIIDGKLVTCHRPSGNAAVEDE